MANATMDVGAALQALQVRVNHQCVRGMPLTCQDCFR
jgi:hypothetical protein